MICLTEEHEITLETVRKIADREIARIRARLSCCGSPGPTGCSRYSTEATGSGKRFPGRPGGRSKPLTAHGATEPSAGSGLLAMKGHAVRKGDRCVVNAWKCFIDNGAVADLVVVHAYIGTVKKAKGIGAFVVGKGNPGWSFGRNESKMRMRGYGDTMDHNVERMMPDAKPSQI